MTISEWAGLLKPRVIVSMAPHSKGMDNNSIVVLLVVFYLRGADTVTSWEVITYGVFGFFWLLLVGCLTSQQHASVYQGRIGTEMLVF